MDKEAIARWRTPAGLTALLGSSSTDYFRFLRLEDLVAAKERLRLPAELPGVERFIAKQAPATLAAPTSPLTVPPQVLFRGHRAPEPALTTYPALYASPFLSKARAYGALKGPHYLDLSLVSTYKPRPDQRYFARDELERRKYGARGHTISELFGLASGLQPRRRLDRLSDFLRRRQSRPAVGTTYIENRRVGTPRQGERATSVDESGRFGVGAYETDVSGLVPDGRYLVRDTGHGVSLPPNPANDSFIRQVFAEGRPLGPQNKQGADMDKSAARYASEPTLPQNNNLPLFGGGPNRFRGLFPLGGGMQQPMKPNPLAQMKPQATLATPEGIMQAAQKMAMSTSSAPATSANSTSLSGGKSTSKSNTHFGVHKLDAAPAPGATAQQPQAGMPGMLPAQQVGGALAGGWAGLMYPQAVPNAGVKPVLATNAQGLKPGVGLGALGVKPGLKTASASAPPGGMVAAAQAPPMPAGPVPSAATDPALAAQVPPLPPPGGAPMGMPGAGMVPPPTAPMSDAPPIPLPTNPRPSQPSPKNSAQAQQEANLLSLLEQKNTPEPSGGALQHDIMAQGLPGTVSKLAYLRGELKNTFEKSAGPFGDDGENLRNAERQAIKYRGKAIQRRLYPGAQFDPVAKTVLMAGMGGAGAVGAVGATALANLLTRGRFGRFYRLARTAAIPAGAAAGSTAAFLSPYQATPFHPIRYIEEINDWPIKRADEWGGDFADSNEDTPTGSNAMSKGWQWRYLVRGIDEGQKQWSPRVFRTQHTPLTELLASPGKQSLLGAGLGAGLGGAAGAIGGQHLDLGPAGSGALGLGGAGLGALLGGLLAYRHRRRRNDQVIDAMRHLPTGATLGDWQAQQAAPAVKQAFDKTAKRRLWPWLLGAGAVGAAGLGALAYLRGGKADSAASLRSLISRHYAKVPGGFDRAVDSALAARQKHSTPSYTNLNFDRAALDRPVPVHFGYAQSDNGPGVARADYDINNDRVTLNPRLFDSPAGMQSSLEHEVSHARLQGQDYVRGRTGGANPLKGILGTIDSSGRQVSPYDVKAREYLSSPAETDVRLAQIKRQFASQTGQLADTPERAQAALDWYMRQGYQQDPDDQLRIQMRRGFLNQPAPELEKWKEEAAKRMTQLVSTGDSATDKIAAQDNSQPRLSAVGESQGLTYNNKPDNYMNGQDAWESVSNYFKGHKDRKSQPNPFLGKHAAAPFAAGFFTRCHELGLNQQQVQQALKQAGAEFGAHVQAELEKAASFEKQAINPMPFLQQAGQWLGRGARAAGPIKATAARATRPAAWGGRNLLLPGLGGYQGWQDTEGEALPLRLAAAAGGAAVFHPTLSRRALNSPARQAMFGMPLRTMQGRLAGGALGNFADTGAELVGMKRFQGLDEHGQPVYGPPGFEQLGKSLGTLAGGARGLGTTFRGLGGLANRIPTQLPTAYMTGGLGQFLPGMRQTINVPAGLGNSLRGVGNRFSELGKGMENVVFGAPKGLWNMARGKPWGHAGLFLPGMKAGLKPGGWQVGGRLAGLAGLGILGSPLITSTIGDTIGSRAMSTMTHQAAPLFNEALGIADERFMQRLHGLGLLNEQGQFSLQQPLNQATHGLPDLMGRAAQGSDHLLRTLGLDLSRMSPLQKLMLLGGGLAAGGGAVAGAPVMAAGGGASMLTALLPYLMQARQNQQPSAPGSAQPSGPPERNEWQVQQQLNQNFR